MLDTTTTELIARREIHLGPTYSLSYRDPLHIVRASGVWMYEASGRAILDAYNNVPVVGHCHPKVVEALVGQAAVLNTNTRYVTDKPVLLAERLLATMPTEIANVVFMCSGSEANDFAIRVARAATGATGVIITENAYHGTSETTAGMSPSARHPLGQHVYTVPSPLGIKQASEFGGWVRECIGRMREDGVTPAALLIDTIASSDGVIADPLGFLQEAAREIRAAGGLLIADEVQAGFGRMGSHMWGFARHGVVPDIVTMGKPMGNGHPIAAMAARGEIMQRFSKVSRYFNTFGGNTVSCAVALAVLSVIEEEGLLENASASGTALRRGLEELSTMCDNLGAVRGTGLYYGVDIRANPRHAADARQEAARIVNGMRQEGVLISSTGRDADVLKIRPPLPIGQKEVTFFLDTLKKVLEA